MLGNPCILYDECYAPGSGRHSQYHYEFLFKRGYFSKIGYEEYRGACALDISGFDCYAKRKKLDDFFNTTNTSMYNIYDKCYRGQNDSSNYVNTGCEDNAGIMTFLNDKTVRANWNIKEGAKEWQPCNVNIYNNFHTGNGSYHLLSYLIKNNLRIVQIY